MKLTQIAAFVALSSAAAISQAAPIWQDQNQYHTLASLVYMVKTMLIL